VGSGATAALTPGGGKVLVTGPLTIAGATGAWAGRVEVADNALAVDWPASGATPVAAIAEQVRSGYAGRTWSGNGITSSQANPNTYAVGFAESAAVLGPGGGSFVGQTVDGSTVLVRRTLRPLQSHGQRPTRQVAPQQRDGVDAAYRLLATITAWK
jgi:hypothetical protein